MSRAITNEQFLDRVYKHFSHDYTFGPYVNMKTKLLVTHKCGNSYMYLPSELVQGHGICHKCFGKNGNKKDNATFTREVENLVGDEYIFLQPYQKSSVKIAVYHADCGNIFYTSPNNFLRNRSCPYCYGNEAKRKTTEQFKQEVYNLVGDEYTVLGEYYNNATDILIRHNKCHRIYPVRPNNFLHGSRCLGCYYDSMRLTLGIVKKRAKEVLGVEYKVLGYDNISHIVTLKHIPCGSVYTTKADDMYQKHTGICNTCYGSFGESSILRSLEELDINYIYQYYPGVRDKKKLSYDFYLPDYNMLIEYQGTQHFYAKTFGGISKDKANKNLALQQKHDKIKANYAKEHNIKLYYFTYKDDTYDVIKNKLINLCNGEHL